MKTALLREPVVAGKFYPADPDDLKKLVTRMLDTSTSTTSGVSIGLIAPHAGYIFSGEVAANAFRLVQLGDKIDTAILVGPSHISGFRFSSVMPEGGYTTPLGEVTIDSQLADAIIKAGANSSTPIRTSDQGHRTEYGYGEHCIEVQLPFLQVIDEDIRIVPIIMGDQSYGAACSLGKAIAEAAGDKNIVLIASTDLSHYYTQREAEVLDSILLRELESYNLERLAEKLENRETQACGSGAIMTVMYASRLLGADQSRILDYRTSGDSPYGDYERVVGYVSATFERTG